MFSKRKNSEAQSRAKAEAAERSDWRRESQLREAEELAQEEDRWHPERASKPPKAKKDFKLPPPSPPIQEENELPDGSKAHTRKRSSSGGERSTAAEQPSSQDPADALEQIARIVQDIHQRSVHAGSATTRDKNQKGRPPADQEDSMQVLTRIAAIVQNTPQGPAQYNKSGNAAKDIDNIRASATAAVEHASGGARRGSVTLAIIRGLDAVNRIINPQQSEQGSEHPAASATSVEGSPSHTEELHREPEPRLAPTRKELKKAEKKEAKKHREVRKVEKDRIKTENKDAKKANKAKKKEEKGRARKEKKGKRLAATDNYLPRLPTTTAWAAAARTDSPVPVPTPDGPAGSSRPLGGGDGAESLFGGPPSSGTCSSGSAVPCRSTCSSANAPWALSACRCR